MKLNPVRTPIKEEPPQARIHGFVEILHPYSMEEAVLEAKRCIQCGRPYCVEACPISQDVRDYIRLLQERKFDEAAKVILRDNPFASTLCKVCYHYCEDACLVGKKGVPVAIRHLKRTALTNGNSELTYVSMPKNHQKVAIIGGGPAGLMAAWELGLRGYSVTVFEREPVLGGQARTIPKYRMSGSELDIDVKRFKNLDITFEMGKKGGVDFTPEKLLKEGYGAVYIALGTNFNRPLGIPGESLPGVFPAFELLKDLNRGKEVAMGKKIVVLGGGDVAMDAVRSVLRLSPGAEVTLIYRRSAEEMPADKEEAHGAEEEGVKFMFLHAPLRIVGTNHVEGIVIQKCELGPPDSSGRRSPVPIPGAEVTVACDTVITAVGQKTELNGFSKEIDLKLGAQGWPEGGRENKMTAIEGVFASGGRSVVYAMAAGSRAAEAIDAYLRGKMQQPSIPRPDPFGGPTPPPKTPKGYTKPTWKV
jgi:glutamate synthase (NADPH/NADH) small chain